MGRVMIYNVAVGMLPLLMVEGSAWRVVDGLPADARIVGISTTMRFALDEIALKVESAMFPEVAEGQVIPNGGRITFARIDA